MNSSERKASIEAAFLSCMKAETRTVYLPDCDPCCRDNGSAVNQWAHIKALTYDGADIDGHKTKVFAYIGFPEGASAAHKVPAMVLVHGGGGHAFAEWVKIWNDRGYAAIAMDTTGFFPSQAGKGIAGKELDDGALWQHGLHDDFEESGYVDAPDNDRLEFSSGPLEKQWIYHAVISTIGAHNVLLADRRVDAERIGITGISWGGVITSIAIGYDTRYAFAVPIYGSGYLDKAHSWMGPIFGREDSKTLWSAAHRFDRIHMPVLWLCWASDRAFSVNSNSLSYDAAADSLLSIRLHWGHSHTRGWEPSESYIFADSVVKGGAGMTRVITQPEGREIRFSIQPDSTAVKVTACIVYITESLSYSVKGDAPTSTIDQEWKTADGVVNGGVVTGSVPADAINYYVEIVTRTPEGEYGVTTRFVEEII